MDGSGNPNNDPSQGQGQQPGQKRDLIYAERMRQREGEMHKERQALADMAKPYDDYATRLAANAFPDNENLFYTIMGVHAARSRERVKTVFAELCGLNGRELEPAVANAIGETYRKIDRVQVMYEWSLFIGITGFVFRKWRRQLSHGLSGIQRYWYPTTRIVGYGFLAFGFVSPIVSVVNKAVHAGGLAKDPRLQGLKLALHHEPNKGASGSYSSYGDAGGQPSPSYDDASPTGSWQAETRAPIQEQANAWRQSDTDAQNSRAGWSQSSQGQGNSSWSRSSEPAPIQANSAWDSGDPIDDASPIASSGSSRSDTRPGESSWERLRRQAGVQGTQQRQPPQVRQPPPSQGGWGENTDTSPQFGGSARSSRDDYSYSSADLEKSTAKDQAQREFDKLLDRERQGVDQENKRWR